ncbi:disulfide bond formation protein B [Novosphingobium decolorationis]|uniref:Disulfide bond formation protein B n=1 Tax=Novosphingobium decolorationis TaxID=2698673 RepID=A0ABX8E890_9SPHN|nr:disulfide bond formation protein B [Novosphingobium decolorationis]QVM84425.1 disulfide bond formation protein B [Novosphingobium decolorationis]
MSVPVPAPVRAARALAFLVPAGLLGGAYISQYVFGLYPCEMCWWQRYPHFFALALAALAFARAPVRPLVAVAALAILTSGLIGAFHAGVELGWWEGVTSCATTAAGGGNPLDAIMAAPVIRCDIVQFSFLGVSMAGWNFLISTASALAILFLIGFGRKA